MRTTIDPALYHNTACPECGKHFQCGAVAGNETCWCFSYSRLFPSGDQQHCLCPECLARAIAMQQRSRSTEKK